MKNKDARQRILDKENIDKVKSEYIADKLKDINYDKIEFENLRRDVEPKYTPLIAELDFCFYMFWQFGESCPFQKWDVQNTKDESFDLFTKLSNTLYDKMAIRLHDENVKRGIEYRKLHDRNTMVDGIKTVSVIDELKTKPILDVEV